MTQSPNRLGNKEYDNIMEYLHDVTVEGSQFVSNMREDWIINCMKQAGLNPEVVLTTLKTLHKTITDPEQLVHITESVVTKFYEDNNIHIMFHPQFPTKEFLMKGDTPIGVWDNNIGIAVEGDKLKMTIQKWGDSK